MTGAPQGKASPGSIATDPMSGLVLIPRALPISCRRGGFSGGAFAKLRPARFGLTVPYRGLAAALTDLLGGQVQVIFSSIPAAIEHIRDGKLQALAATSAVRAEALPDLPTVGEFVPGLEASQWYGIAAPKAHPPRSLTS
jgi:hypothetical protein